MNISHMHCNLYSYTPKDAAVDQRLKPDLDQSVYASYIDIIATGWQHAISSLGPSWHVRHALPSGCQVAHAVRSCQ